MIGLYRDDSLACFANVSGPQTDWIKKDFVDIFKSEFLINIACDAVLKIVKFLDVNLNLSNDKYQSYNMPGNSPII